VAAAVEEAVGAAAGQQRHQDVAARAAVVVEFAEPAAGQQRPRDVAAQAGVEAEAAEPRLFRPAYQTELGLLEAWGIPRD
jgi:hypothetical protein